MDRPLFTLFEKNMKWCWNSTINDAFEDVKFSIFYAPELALSDPVRLSIITSDASDFANR